MLKLISRWMTVNNGSKRSAQLRQLAAQQNTFRHTMPVYRHHAPKRIRNKKKVLLLAPQQCLHAQTTKSKKQFSRTRTRMLPRSGSRSTPMYLLVEVFTKQWHGRSQCQHGLRSEEEAQVSLHLQERGGQGRVSEVETAQGVNSSLILLPLSFF